MGVERREASTMLGEDQAVGHAFGQRPLFAQEEHISWHLGGAASARLASELSALAKRRQPDVLSGDLVCSLSM